MPHRGPSLGPRFELPICFWPILGPLFGRFFVPNSGGLKNQLAHYFLHKNQYFLLPAPFGAGSKMGRQIDARKSASLENLAFY